MPSLIAPERTDRVTELMESLTGGVEQLTTSDHWLGYLEVAGRFHRYSYASLSSSGAGPPSLGSPRGTSTSCTVRSPKPAAKAGSDERKTGDHAEQRSTHGASPLCRARHPPNC